MKAAAAKAKAVNDKHQISTKARSLFSKALATAKQVDAKHDVTGKVSRGTVAGLNAVASKMKTSKAKADAEAAREPSAPIGLRFFESIADKIPGPVGVFAQDAMSHFATNALHYYLTFVTLPIALIILFIAVKSMRPTDEQKSKKAQQAKDAKKKKDDDVKEDDDENEGDENEPPAEDEKKTPSKRRVRRSS